MNMKKSLILFWNGLTGIISGIAEWFTVILGMKDESKYGRFLRRVVGSCFTLVVLILTFAAVVGTYEGIAGSFSDDDSDEFYDIQYLSKDITYYVRDYGEDGYVENAEGKKTISGIKWISKPLGFDSLICYSNGRKCGYFNMYSGKTVIAPKYNHACFFSEGLASVDDDGWIKFINGKGEVIIDLQIPYMSGSDGYAFHNEHCVVNKERRDRFGLIDKHSNWVLEPEYISITPCDTFWIVDNGKEQSVITDNMQTVIPFMPSRIDFSDNTIVVTMDNHTIKTFTLQGELIDDFCIRNIERMTYSMVELDSNGIMNEDNTIQVVAKCKRYEAEYGWYGLMTSEGHILTPPSYSDIIAIEQDLYLCKNSDCCGILLDGKGNKVN